MASWQEPTDPDPLAFFIGLRNACLYSIPFWLAVIAIVILILREE